MAVKRTLLDWVLVELKYRPEHWTPWNINERRLERDGIDHVSGISVILGNRNYPLVISLGQVQGLKDATSNDSHQGIFIGPTHDYLPLAMYYGWVARRRLLRLSDKAFAPTMKGIEDE